MSRKLTTSDRSVDLVPTSYYFISYYLISLLHVEPEHDLLSGCRRHIINFVPINVMFNKNLM